MKKIVVLKGSSQFGALRTFADEIVKGFEELSCQCTVLDLLKETDELNNNLDKIEECDFIFTFNGVAVASQSFTQYLNSQKKTVINFYVDHPYYHEERICSGLEHCINIFVCKSQLTSAKYISKIEKDLVAYIPHGGLKSLDFLPGKSQYESRQNRILFSGSSNLTDADRPWSNERPSDRVCDEVYEQMLLGLGFEDAFDVAENKVGLSFHNREHNLNLRRIVFANVVPYMRARNRFETVKQLVQSGVPVDIYGDENWTSIAKVLGVNYKGMLPMEELVSRFKDYKFVVNDFCAHPYGSHERISNVMLNGAYLISYESEFLKNFPSEGYLSFNAENMNTLSERIKNLSGAELFNATLDNFKLAGEHQWYKRSKDIVDLFDLYSAINQ
ncbi:hypothetical protein [Vibrio sp. C8]